MFENSKIPLREKINGQFRIRDKSDHLKYEIKNKKVINPTQTH